MPGSEGDWYNFGERPQPGEEIGESVTATIGFWHNKNGQALIESLTSGDHTIDDSETSTQLGDWLAATFPNMYGSGAAYEGRNGDTCDMNLAGKTNTEVAETFRFLFKRNKKNAVTGGPPKVDAQVMAAGGAHGVHVPAAGPNTLLPAQDHTPLHVPGTRQGVSTLDVDTEPGVLTTGGRCWPSRGSPGPRPTSFSDSTSRPSGSGGPPPSRRPRWLPVNRISDRPGSVG